MPGTLGVLQPGYFCKGTAVWKGPEQIAQMVGYQFGVPNEIETAGPPAFAVTPVIASQMALSDANWWDFH